MGTIDTVSILGCGWFGRALAVKLLEQGILVKGSTRSDNKMEELKRLGIDAFKISIGQDPYSYSSDFFKCDILIIAIPPGRKDGLSELYPQRIEIIRSAIIAEGIKRVVFISSTGVYADDCREVTEDNFKRAETDSGRVLLEAESTLKNENSFKLTILRFAGLIGPGRDPARFFSGKRNIPNGLAPVNLIHLNDCIGITFKIFERNAFGFTINACSAEHPSKMDFYTKAAINSGLELPVFSAELGNWKIVRSNYLKAILDYEPGGIEMS